MYRGLIFRNMIQKAITVRQPYAWLIVNGFKTVENRSEHESRWSFRGPLAIHAGKARVPDEVYVRCCKKLGRKIPKDELHLGGIVGIAELIDIVDDYRSKWFSGPFGLVLRNARPIEFIPFSGQLGLWNLPTRLRRRLARV
jgi:hypothetical protein